MPKSNRDYNNLEETSSQSSADAGAGSGGVRSSSTTTSGGAGSSSFTSLPTWSSSPHALKRVDKLVSSLLSRNDSAPFREPVDWRAMELWDYPKIVRKMMDLGTIKRKLERGEYRTVQDVVADVRLVWKNCMLYNADGSDFYLLAEGFSSRFEERWKKLRTELESTEDSAISSSGGGGVYSKFSADRPPPLDARTRFGHGLYRLSGEELGHVLQIVDRSCPAALGRPRGSGSTGRSAGNELELDVDALDSPTFWILERYTREKGGEKLGGSSGGGNTEKGGMVGGSGGGGGRTKKRGGANADGGALAQSVAVATTGNIPKKQRR